MLFRGVLAPTHSGSTVVVAGIVRVVVGARSHGPLYGNTCESVVATPQSSLESASPPAVT